MSESSMRRNVVKALRPLDGCAVETKLEDGIPDVNYVGGWIECKCLKAWPVRPATPVRLDHPLMPHQAAWLCRRWRRGGKAWVLLQVGREWLLFDPPTAKEKLGTATREELRLIAARYWPNGLNAQELIDAVT